ncbi:hypothetical protein MRX96_038204 [Rhipicephalus microplus]
MASSMRLLVCGDVGGQFDKLFDRVSRVNTKHGPFDMLLCVGDFFGPDTSRWLQYKLSGRKVPLQTYAVGITPESYSDSDLADNVVHLGSRGIFTGASGLKIAYFCGNESKDGKPSRGEFVKKEAVEFLTPIVESTSHKGIDLFITSQWPKNMPLHVIRGDTYYERTPYRNHKVLQEQARHVTRFISLASVGNATKAKWLYAFSMDPMSSITNAELVKQPTDVTECPYEFSESDLKDASSKSQQFFYDLTPAAEKGKKRNRDSGDRQERKKRPPPAPQGTLLVLPGQSRSGETPGHQHRRKLLPGAGQRSAHSGSRAHTAHRSPSEYGRIGRGDTGRCREVQGKLEAVLQIKE